VSKNYELLQQVEKEKERQLFRSEGSSESKTQTQAESQSVQSLSKGSGRRLRLHPREKEESVRLVQQLFLSSKEDGLKSVMFVAVESGDGSTTVCSRAGEALASQSEGSICLVDTNFRNPALHKAFGLENRQGLADAIAQSGPIRNFALQVAGSNLWVLPAGNTAESKERLVNSEGMRARIAELMKMFDFVLLDSPAVSVYGDALTIGALVSGAVLVLQSDSTRRQAALSAKEAMESAGIRLLGAVLNKRTYPIPQALYDRL
jgi:capsular exopolysaccharide synthesis family protein